jgi:uncharacterized protein YdaU (DUF1376 family)
MAKDPAFLFYPGDWLGGTMTLTRHQKGCYIDILMAQFHSGPLSLESIKTVLGTDQAVWTVLSKKFQQDSDGNYFSERLAHEMKTRKAYTQSRRTNAEKKDIHPPNTAYPNAHAEHMLKHMEDENEDENRIGIKKEKPPSKIAHPTPFETSPVYLRPAWDAACPPSWTPADRDHWWLQAEASSNRGNRYKDWIAAVTNWKRKDIHDLAVIKWKSVDPKTKERLAMEEMATQTNV